VKMATGAPSLAKRNITQRDQYDLSSERAGAEITYPVYVAAIFFACVYQKLLLWNYVLIS
jgi:hypothetical protein